MSDQIRNRDASLKITRALPADDTAVLSDPIDTGKSTSLGAQVANIDYELAAPALATGQLADTKTMTYDVVHGDAADLSDAVDLYPGFIVQTGAGGAGAAAATKLFRIPSDAKQYVGFRVTPSAAADASAANATLDVLM